MAKRAKQDAAENPRAVPGDNSAEVGGIAAERLLSVVQRVERLQEERKALGNDIKDIMAEAKSAGFDTKTVREVLRRRQKEPAELEEQDTLRDLYERALSLL